MSRSGQDDDWPVTWEAQERDQLLRIARETTPAQRLAWLEEALRFAHKAGALPKREPPGD